MDRLEAAHEWAQAIDPEAIAADVREIGFECTRCGRCCRGTGTDPHTATVFPDEIRAIQSTTGRAWDEIARPMPFGVREGRGETFEWALQIDDGGDCTFLETADTQTRCAIYDERPRLCRTYPFSLGLPGTGESRANAVAIAGRVRASECPGLGAEISRKRSLAIAKTLKERAVRELEEILALREQYEPHSAADGIVVHDSEGAKDPHGTPLGPSSGDRADW
ncbi:MAG: YkgJ family cysteine cluster protein [Halodesulfurarchaeum sp.]